MIYVFLRSTEDWKDISIDQCRQPITMGDGSSDHLPEPLVNLLEDWNKKYQNSWQKFRYRLKEKATEICPVQVISKYSDVHKLNNNDIVIPMDDDDWLHPEISDFINSEMGDSIDVLQWQQICNSYINIRSLSYWGQDSFQRSMIYCTSDHCIKAGFLKKLSQHELHLLLQNHKYLLRKLYEAKRLYVPEPMSCYNQHIGSYTCLIRCKDVSNLASWVVPLKHPIDKKALWASSLIEWLHTFSELTTNKKVKMI